MGCFFCHPKRFEEAFYQNRHFIARFSHVPVSPGHVEISLKEHRPSVFSLSREETASLFDAVLKSVEMLEKMNMKNLYSSPMLDPSDKGFERHEWFRKRMLDLPWLGEKPMGYNLGVNEGQTAGRTVSHVHIHLIPRYDNDFGRPGGVRNVIPELGNYTNLEELERLFMKGILKKLLESMKGLDMEWMLAGSAMLFIRGIVDSFNDIDIVFREDDVEKLMGHFMEFNPKYIDHGNWKEITFNYFGNAISFMTSDEEGIYVKSLKNRKIAKWEGMEIPVISLEDQAKSYELTGKKEKAEWLRNAY